MEVDIEKNISNNCEEKNQINEVNNELDYLNKLFKYIKRNNKEDGNINIIKQFVSDKNILQKEESLILFIEELKNQLELGNNILMPFLDICPTLIKSYIESNLDEEGEMKYIEIFNLLKINSFISREYLYPIYEFFSDLFYNISELEENDQKIKKLDKVFELWKIFYNFEINEDEIKYFNSSSYCSLGEGLEIKFPKNISIDKTVIKININLFDNTFFDFNENLIFFFTKSDKQITYKLDDKEIKNSIGNKSFNKIYLELNNKIKIKIYNNNENIIEKQYNTKIKNIENLYLLKNFYGQLKSIQIDIGSINNNFYKPNLMKDNGYICKNNNINNSHNKEEISYAIEGDSNESFEIKIKNTNCFKANYINYLDNNFNLIEYFGGLSQFTPFILLINGIYENEKINTINRKTKKEFLINKIHNFFYIFLKIIEKYKSSFSKVIKKYSLIFYCWISNINEELIVRQKELKEIDIFDNIITIIYDIFRGEEDYLSLLSSFINNDFNSNNEKLTQIINKEIKEIKRPIFIKKSIQQLFRNIVKELFIYNRFWSRKEIFYNNVDNKYKLKYKQLSYYTKNFQQPLLYPILEFLDYLPSFSRFEKINLFNHDLKETINYNFNLKENKNIKIVNEYNPMNGIEDREKCCLVKRNYHVKGEIIIKNDEEKNDFDLIFSAFSEQNGATCNKTEYNLEASKRHTIINCKNIEICYGSIFPCPKKEYNRKILIKSKNIKFILIRNYYRRTSAIEIFTYNPNKSYYFNFNNIIDDNENKVIKILNETLFLKKIKSTKNFLGAYYNINYKKLMFPLFSDDMKNWKNKIYLYNNFDLLTIINLLSNRSFKDLYQYPIFPTLYRPCDIKIDKERDLGVHLGLQELTNKSKIRKALIEESFKCLKDEIINSLTPTEDDNEELYLFSTHYSTPPYICYYLLRVFPFSLASIEFQGEGFDSPNRLFYSITKSFENNLSQKADLRESIPELYYFPELFSNYNDLNFGSVIGGEKVNDVLFDNNNNYSKFNFLEKSKNHLEFDGLKINKWIDLIFGKNQKKEVKKDEKKNYYKEDKYISLDKKIQEQYKNDSLIMETFEFGIQPLQIFKEEFPPINKNINKKQIIENNINLFKEEHITINNNREFCFKYISLNNDQDSTNIYNDDNKIFKKLMKKTKKYMLNQDFNYIFIGNILGNLTIIEKNLYNINKKTNNITGDNYKVIKKLTDHYKQIKYIDYNPRLNLFLSYSLDGFINIYVFPKCKLVRAIKVSNITNSNDILEKVVLVSNPFPMIFTYDKNNMYTITLNGELIKKEELKDKNIEIYPSIDKLYGLINDYICIKKGDDKELKYISLPSLLQIKGVFDKKKQ